MDHDNAHGADHGEHGGVHLPDPSIWPLVVGAAALILGLALVWWSRERESSVAGPFLGAAAVFTLVSAAGWAYEDGRMRKKAEQGDVAVRKAPRYTQVITFTIAEGMAESAHSRGGILAALEKSDGVVKDLAGFQDMRITVSPGNTGPLQVLAETTWADREGLTTYDAAQTTLLDIINAHNAEIIPGSVQAFDMEVVRDTKETAFSFGRSAAFALLGSFVVGGFMIGAGLNLFGSDAVAVEAGPGTPTALVDVFKPVLTGRDNVFAEKTLTMAANADVQVTFNNKGKIPHNVHFLTAKGGQTLADGAEGEIIGGGLSTVLSFKSPGPGSYFYRCDVHPELMTGTLTVAEAPPPAAGAAAASPAAAK